jgi:hypothetical protein
MRFTDAWADVAAKNTALKFVVLILALCCVIFSVTATRLALKEPLVIERSCFSKVAQSGPSNRSPNEIEAFANEAINRRFNSDAATSDGYLSSEEDAGRRKDQQTLAGQGMRQRVLVNSVKIDGNQLTIDSDRLISVGSVRSAFSFPLTATIATVTRTEANPYGLVLMKLIGPEELKKEKRK